MDISIRRESGPGLMAVNGNTQIGPKVRQTIGRDKIQREKMFLKFFKMEEDGMTILESQINGALSVITTQESDIFSI